MIRRFAPLLAFATLIAALPAVAQTYDENPFGHTLYAQVDSRLTLADGEPSWIDGGFGKTREGGDATGDARLRARIVEADLVWQPKLGWALGATIAVTAQQGQEQPVDLSEAYLSYRHAPIGGLKLSARLGLMWPPVSTEHAGPAWSVTETITPSAINSWVGEEVKVAAAEASASVPLGAGRLTGTAAVFAWNDTAGTLLSFRGWALHDQKATAFSLQRLPPLDPFMRYAQSPDTSPLLDLDGRPGFYGKIGWSAPGASIAAFYYDNRGDPEAADAYMQWAWRTRFTNLAVQIKPDARTTITSQALVGTTRMGFPMNGRIWIDTRFRSAFLLATRAITPTAHVSGRIEAFDTQGRGSVLATDTDETGWALTLAGKLAIDRHIALIGEVLRVDSRRQDRARAGLAPSQVQNVAQVGARIAL